jgi:hypothetical protein
MANNEGGVGEYRLVFYFRGGNNSLVRADRETAIEIAEQWSNWFKAQWDRITQESARAAPLSEAVPVPFAGGEGWGVSFPDVVAVQAYEIVETREDQFLAIQLEHAKRHMREMRREDELRGGGGDDL